MNIIAEIFIEIIFRSLIVHGLGVYTRFYFFKLIRKPKSMKYLTGEKNVHDSTDKVQQPVFNAIIGLTVFALISISIAYLVYN